MSNFHNRTKVLDPLLQFSNVKLFNNSKTKIIVKTKIGNENC